MTIDRDKITEIFFMADNFCQLYDRFYSNQLITGHENYYFRLMFLRIVRLLDYACSLDLWDGKHLLVIGESQGGAQAFAAAGLDERVGGCVAIVPAMNDLGARFDGRYGSWPFVVESSVNNNNPLRDEILPYYDAAHLVSMSGASFFVEVGLIDSTCPAAAVWSGINNITGDKEIVSFYQRNHTSLDPSTVDRTWWNTNVYQRRDAWIKEYLAK